MATITAPAPAPQSTDTGGDVVHYCHCDPRTAICGIRAAGTASGDAAVTCPLCALAYEQFHPCHLCGQAV